MNLKNTLFMAVVLAVIAVFIFRVEIPEGERKERESFVLKKIPDDKLAFIKLIGEKDSFVFRKAKNESGIDAWQLEGLADAQLDQSAVTAIVKGLQDFKSDAPINSDEVAKDLSVYGLNSPTASIEVGEGEGRTAVRFGKSNDFIGKRYAQILAADGSSQIILADDVLFNAAKKEKSDFREKNPVQFPDFSVSRLTIESPQEKRRMVLTQTEGVWKIIEPVQALADDAAVAAFFRDLRGLKVAEFIDNVTDRSTYRLDAPALQIEIGFSGDKKPLLVAVADAPSTEGEVTKKALYLSLGGQSVFKTTEGQVLTLRRTPLDFRNKKPFQLEVDSISKLMLSTAFENTPRVLMLEKQEDSWKVNGAEGDVVFVRQLLSDLSAVEAVDFPLFEISEKDFETPLAKFQITVKDNAGKESVRELLVARELDVPSGGKGFLACEKGKLQDAFLISRSSLEKLTPLEETLKKQLATPAPLEKVVIAEATKGS